MTGCVRDEGLQQAIRVPMERLYPHITNEWVANEVTWHCGEDKSFNEIVNERKFR